MNEKEHVRPLDTTSAAALVIASMIGVGVFTTSGFALADLGSRAVVLAAWCVGGVVAMCGALSYGSLSARLPESGGEYLFLSRTVHPLAGFLAGWVSLLAGFTAPIAAAGLGLHAYLGDSFGLSMGAPWPGTLVIAGAGLLHSAGVRQGLRFQNAIVALKVLLILGFLIAGTRLIGTAEAGDASLSSFDLGAFGVTLVWVSFSYSGWNAAVYLAGECRDGSQGLKRALILGTGITMALYVALNAVFLYSAPVSALAGRADVGAVAAEALGGKGLRQFVSGIVALALVTSISSLVVAGPRVYAKMAEDGLFPRAFAAELRAPRAAIALQCSAAIVVLWVGTLAKLLSYIGFTLGICAAASVLALVYLRIREGADRVPIPGYPIIPLIFIVATLGSAGLMAYRDPAETAIGLGITLLGVPAYFLAKSDRWPLRANAADRIGM